MSENETIDEMYAYFTNIIIGLKALGKDIPMNEQMSKILHSHTNKYEKKVTTIEEASTYVRKPYLFGNL